MIKKLIFTIIIPLFITMSCSRPSNNTTATTNTTSTNSNDTCIATSLDVNTMKRGDSVLKIKEANVQITSTNTKLITFTAKRPYTNNDLLTFKVEISNGNNISYGTNDYFKDSIFVRAYIPYYYNSSGTKINSDYSNISTIKNADSSYTVTGCVKLYLISTTSSSESVYYSIRATAK